jgi:hypothetical protein
LNTNPVEAQRERDRMASESNSGGIGFAGLLTVAFVVLKLRKVISWSWWWVLSPLWISFGLVLVLLAIALLVTALS